MNKMLDFIKDFRSLHEISLSACKNLINFYNSELICLELLAQIVFEIKLVTDSFIQMVESNKYIFLESYSQQKCNIQNFNYIVWLERNKFQYDSLLYCIRLVIVKLLKEFEEKTINFVIKLASFYNQLVDLNLHVDVDVLYATSSTSLIVQNRKKITIARILKVLVSSRTVICATRLIADLLEKFVQFQKIENSSINYTYKTDFSVTDCTDQKQKESDINVIVFNTLSQYTSENNKPFLASFLKNEQMRLYALFVALSTETLNLSMGFEAQIIKKFGSTDVMHNLYDKIIYFYNRELWQNVGLVSEHLLLWWLNNSLGRRHPMMAQKFNSYLNFFCKTENINEILRPTIMSIIDCVYCYITTTYWDEQFRRALISAKYPHSRHDTYDIGLGTYTGKLFTDLLYKLEFLANSCENDYAMLGYENLPFSEQIPILHRIDHTIHVTRQWFLNRAKYLSNNWNMEQFFRVTHVDANAAIYALSQLKLNENINDRNLQDSHVHVLYKIRIKLINEININVVKLKDVQKHSLTILASICKITCLEHLRINFPQPQYWQRLSNNKDGIVVNDYVEKYINEIMEPVLLATQNLTLSSQKSVLRLILEILCEAWLDHIYIFKIKFSEFGAKQLLKDFSAITTWIENKVNVKELKKMLRCSEILRRCEGVGSLLLRQPGESINMNYEDFTIADGQCENDDESLMPPEMYVPNQEKWLHLRLNNVYKSKPTCC